MEMARPLNANSNKNKKHLSVIWQTSRAALFTYSLLAELEGSLVLADFEQLHAALLVGSESTHLSHKVTHKFDVFAWLKHKQMVLTLQTRPLTIYDGP